MKPYYHRFPSTFALVVSLLLGSGALRANGDWDISFEPYSLAVNIDGTASIGRVVGAPVNVGFGDILENLKMAAMLHVEGFNNTNNWGVILDYGYMNLGGRGSRGILTAGVKQGILEAFIAKRIQTETGHIDWYAGVRSWNNKIDLVLDPAILPGSRNITVREQWVDIVFGARSVMPLNERWTMLLRADVGGFGASSELTYAGSAGLNYHLSDNWLIDIQYKGVWVDYESGAAGAPDSFYYDTVSHGPLVGISYTF